MKIILRTFIFLYFIFLLILINILSISDYEWMIGEGDIDNLCQLPLNGRYIIEPILILTPCILLLFLEKNKKLRWGYVTITVIYIIWSFYLRFNFC
ncbi:TPA: YjeO family protein [Proteus mirabilis]|nr:YjeO family protein [Proteus mirabilis]HEJ9434591.1 YjeO family protein [Proteus mirabilis]HEK2846117.1 YjeO family protein [Proteus mirabilis]